MSVLKYKDPVTGEVKSVGAPSVDAEELLQFHNSDKFAHEDIRSEIELSAATDNTLLLNKENTILPDALTYWGCASYGNGTFVVLPSNTISESPVLAYSNDGVTWKPSSAPYNTEYEEAYQFNNMAYGNGVFVAVSQSGLGTSSDGLSWSMINELPSGMTGATHVCFGGGKFVTALSMNDGVNYSVDGVNWEATTLPSSGKFWSGLTYGNGKFVLISQSAGIYATSPDGIHWTQHEGVLPELGWNRIVYGNGKFIIFNDLHFAYSADGITWEESDISADLGITRVDSVIFGDGKFIAVGRGGVCLYSTDGINWKSSNLPKNTRWSTLAFGEGRFITTAYSGTDVAFSDDGIHWYSSSGIYLNSGENVTNEVREILNIPENRNDGLYLGEALKTKVLRDWETTSNEYLKVTYGNGVFVGFKQNAVDTSCRDTYYSLDQGVTWKAPTSQQGSSTVTGVHVSYGPVFINGYFYIATYYLDSFNRISRSPDGVNWTEVWMDTSNSYTWKGFANNGNTIVAVAQTSNSYAGYAKQVIISNDNGATWSKKEVLPDYGTWFSVVYNDGAFVAAFGQESGGASSTYIARSTDNGLTWSRVTLPIRHVWHNLHVVDGKIFLGANDSDTVLTSVDGTSWTQVSEDIWDYICNDNIFCDGYYYTVYGNKVYRTTEGYTWEEYSQVPSGSAMSYLACDGEVCIASSNGSYSDKTYRISRDTYAPQITDSTGESINEAVASALGSAKIEYGSYKGSGNTGSSYPNKLTFGFDPKIVFVSGGNLSHTPSIFVSGSTRSTGPTTSSQYMLPGLTVTWGDKTLSWYVNGDHTGGNYVSAMTPDNQLNNASYTYYYVAIG